MKKVVVFVCSIVIVCGALYYANSYISNAQNYISVDKIKKQMGEEYDALMEFYSKIGIEEQQFTDQVESLQNDLQSKLDESSFVFKINYYIFYNNASEYKDITELLISENKYIDSLTEEERQRYIDMYNGVSGE